MKDSGVNYMSQSKIKISQKEFDEFYEIQEITEETPKIKEDTTPKDNTYETDYDKETIEDIDKEEDLLE